MNCGRALSGIACKISKRADIRREAPQNRSAPTRPVFYDGASCKKYLNAPFLSGQPGRQKLHQTTVIHIHSWDERGWCINCLIVKFRTARNPGHQPLVGQREL